jgi:hypothetical protein
MPILFTTLVLRSAAVLAAGSAAEGAAMSKARVTVMERETEHPFRPHGAFVLTGAAGRDWAKATPTGLCIAHSRPARRNR